MIEVFLFSHAWMLAVCSEDRVLNRVANVIEDLIFEALCTDREQTIFEVFLQHCDVICPCLESFAHQVLSVPG